MDTKRLVLAFALSAAVLIGWTILFPAPKPAAPAARPAVTTPAMVPSAATAAPATQTPAPAPAPREKVVPVSAAAEELVEVRSPLYTARLSNEGGTLKSFVLTHHRDGAGKALDLVRQSPPFPGVTLTLDPADPFLQRAQKAHFTVEKESGNGVTSVRFRYREASGEGLVRSYVFRDSYVVAVKAEREGASGAPVGLVLGPGIGNPSPEELASRYSKPGETVTLSASASVDRKAKDSLKEPTPKGTGLVAAGIEEDRKSVV